MRAPRVLIVGLAVVLLSGVAATSQTQGASPPKITVAGIKLRMSPAQVIAVLGQPLKKRREMASGRTIHHVWYFRDRLQVVFDAYDSGKIKRVGHIRTYSPRDVLPGGVRVGVKIGKVYTLRPRPYCHQYSGNSSRYPDGYLCNWQIRLSNGACGPLVFFYLPSKTSTVKYIEVSENDGEGCPS